MRLWHQHLIDKLPRQQLLGQHRECCALRGLGWGRKHATVDYVFRHPYLWLFYYHQLVMDAITARGYTLDRIWTNAVYRGKRLGNDYSDFVTETSLAPEQGDIIYPEHNMRYMGECVENLARKGVHLSIDAELRMKLQLMGFKV